MLFSYGVNHKMKDIFVYAEIFLRGNEIYGQYEKDCFN